MEKYIDIYLQKSIKLLQKLPSREIAKAMNILQATYERDGRIFVFGNGGSLSMATHFVSDFNKTVFSHHLEKKIRRFQAIRLPSTEEELTAWANDVGYDMVFAGPLRNYMRDGDTVIAISSSGNSPNIIKAVKLAKKFQIPVIGISGFDGGELNSLADAKIIVNTNESAYEQVEGIHSVILHLMTQYFREYFNYLSDNEK